LIGADDCHFKTRATSHSLETLTFGLLRLSILYLVLFSVFMLFPGVQLSEAAPRLLFLLFSSSSQVLFPEHLPLSETLVSTFQSVRLVLVLDPGIYLSPAPTRVSWHYFTKQRI